MPAEERLIERATDIAALVIARERAEHALQAQAAALAASEARHRALLANTPDAAWCIDRAGRVLFVSPRIEAVTSLSAAEFAARGRQVWRERVHPEDERAIDEGWIELFEGGGAYDVEYRFCRKDGRWVWLHSRAVTIDSEAGQPIAYGVVSDITERKQASEIRARLLNHAITAQEEERRRIARELHDDTAQSLASLLVGLDVLRSARTLRDARRQAQDLHRVAARALDEVRLLARGLRPSVLDDLGLLAAAERYATEFQKSRGIAVYVRASGVDRRLPASVETALYRIMQEALANVAKHAGARAASVVIERRAASVAMAVSDDGHGFDVSAVLADSQTAGHIGSARHARARPAARTARSRSAPCPARDTRVLAEVPGSVRAEAHVRRRSGSSSPTTTPSSARASAPSSTPSPTCASSPRQATASRPSARRRSTHPDVAIVDISMPELSGIDAIERLRHRSAGTRVLILTMHDDVAYARAALAAGASGHIVKDVEGAELLTAIRADAPRTHRRAPHARGRRHDHAVAPEEPGSAPGGARRAERAGAPGPDPGRPGPHQSRGGRPPVAEREDGGDLPRAAQREARPPDARRALPRRPAGRPARRA